MGHRVLIRHQLPFSKMTDTNRKQFSDGVFDVSDVIFQQFRVTYGLSRK
jgi:hypothetical protein